MVTKSYSSNTKLLGSSRVLIKNQNDRKETDFRNKIEREEWWEGRTIEVRKVLRDGKYFSIQYFIHRKHKMRNYNHNSYLYYKIRPTSIGYYTPAIFGTKKNWRTRKKSTSHSSQITNESPIKFLLCPLALQNCLGDI